jgi:hypothetical protein
MWQEANWIVLLLLVAVTTGYTSLDTRCDIVIGDDQASVTAARILSERAAEHDLMWNIAKYSNTKCSIHIRLTHDGSSCNSQMPSHSEGFVICAHQHNITVVRILGSTPISLLFGVGHVLRTIDFATKRLILPTPFTSVPDSQIRGHQMSYRYTSNSYDSWDIAQVRRYIQDLVLFGANTIEILSPDGSQSPYYPVSQSQMNEAISKICDEMNLRLSIWYPFDLKDTEWGSAWRNLSRLDAVFVPGGDPGDTSPALLFVALERKLPDLHKYHPKCEFWISNQGFNATDGDIFLQLAAKSKWLTGVVYGPHTRFTIKQVREKLPSHIPIYHYPDVCHQLKAQFPQPNWRTLFAFTESREAINPRITQFQKIFQNHQPYTIGFSTYTDGATDDVNMMLWGALGWNSKTSLVEFAQQYTRLFVHDEPPFIKRFAQVLFLQEQNWIDQDKIDHVLNEMNQLRVMLGDEKYQNNWRFQMAYYRAYYDAYQQTRYIQEQSVEKDALTVLAGASQIGSLQAMNIAQDILSVKSRRNDLRGQCFIIADDLFHSIGMKLSVPLYKAKSIGRGASLDTIDNPLNNRRYLIAQFDTIRNISNEQDRVLALNGIIQRDVVGEHEYYDDLGNTDKQPHLITGLGPDLDPSYYESVLSSFQEPFNISQVPPVPLQWLYYAETFYDTPLEMQYKNLDTSKRYVLKFVFGPENPQTRMRLVANGKYEVHPLIPKPVPRTVLQFDIPFEATSTGSLHLSWTIEQGRGGNGRGCQIAEVWLQHKV